MEFVTRLAGEAIAGRYPFQINSPAIWSPQREGNGWCLEVSLPNLPAKHIVVPSFALVGDGEHQFQFVMSWDDRRCALQPVPAEGTGKQPAAAGSEDAVTAHIDCWHTHADVAAPRIMLAVATETPPVDYLLTVTVRPLEIEPASTEHNTEIKVAVPRTISQMQADDSIKQRICSPTALAMALSLYPDAPAWDATVAACYDPLTKAYGSWPLAIRWASRHNIIGAVETFSTWQQALTVLAAGLPLVCSIRFKTNALAGAPLQHTGGHLVLLHGVEGSDVLVKDPAADTDAEVDRRYQLDEFIQAWLRHRGAAYIFCTQENLRD